MEALFFYNFLIRQIASSGKFYQYNIQKFFWDAYFYMFSASPEYYCWQTKFTYMYKNFFNPYKHAVDLAIFNQILGTSTFTGQEVIKKDNI